MHRTTAEEYRRWFEYEKDSHQKVLASLNAVPAQLRSSSACHKAVDLMAHLIAARLLWLYRFGAATEPPREMFPEGVPIEDLSRRLSEMESAWSVYFARLDAAEIARVFAYRSLDAGWFRNTIGDILTQLFGHSWYHRGQIAALVRSLGCDPAVTDFVFWTREPIPEPAA
jgi:uncharacterized damage-inducible protein DinB